MNNDMRARWAPARLHRRTRPERRQHPKALKLYGIDESEYSGDAQMFDLVHAMRSRIITNPPSMATR